jgi:hypothetical protein
MQFDWFTFIVVLTVEYHQIITMFSLTMGTTSHSCQRSLAPRNCNSCGGLIAVRKRSPIPPSFSCPWLAMSWPYKAMQPLHVAGGGRGRGSVRVKQPTPCNASTQTYTGISKVVTEWSQMDPSYGHNKILAGISPDSDLSKCRHVVGTYNKTEYQTYLRSVSYRV